MQIAPEVWTFKDIRQRRNEFVIPSEIVAGPIHEMCFTYDEGYMTKKHTFNNYIFSDRRFVKRYLVVTHL